MLLSLHGVSDPAESMQAARRTPGRNEYSEIYDPIYARIIHFFVADTVLRRRSFDFSRIFFIVCDFPPLNETSERSGPFPDFFFERNI